MEKKFFGQKQKSFRYREVPVKEGQELEVEIEAIGSKGDGIAREQGFVLFVPDTKKGDKVKVRIKKVLRSVAFAEKI